MALAVKNAAARGLTIVAAAGNSGGSVGFPGAYPESIAIAASDLFDGVTGFSSRGPEVDLIAPGQDINSTKMGGGYHRLAGTSMASPHVAGLAALAIAAHGAQNPADLKKLLIDAAKKLPRASAELQGAGIVDAGRLVSSQVAAAVGGL